MSETPWYREFFGEDYLRLYTFLTDERSSQEVEAIIKLLDLPAGSTILDLACGHGRHAIRLAERGYRVTGLDLSEVFLQRARAEAEAKGVEVRWVHVDMRSIPFQREFDAVINIFTAFGYFENETEDQQVLDGISRALRPGGLFLLETMYRDALFRRFLPSSITRHEDGLVVLEEREFEHLTSRITDRLTMLFPDGTKKEYGHSLRLYTLRELSLMLGKSALQIEAHYGGLDGSPLTLDSRRLVVVSRKHA